MILDKPEIIQQYTTKGWWGNNTLIDLFQRHVAQRGQEMALVDPPNRAALAFGEPLRLTYAELNTQVDRLATALVQNGVKKDDVVMVQLPNIVELVMVYLAVARIGAIISPLPIQYRSYELRYAMGIVEPKVFVTLDTFENYHYLDMILGLKAEFPSLETIIAIGESLPNEVLNLTHIFNTLTDDTVLNDYLGQTTWTANDIYTVCWTSGTEAEPKGVPRSHNHWISIAWFTVDGCQMDDGHKLLNPFPMVNMSAIGGMLVPWLLTGGKLVMHHPLNLPVFLQQIMAEEINYTVAPPVLLNLLLLKPALMEGVNLSSIKNIGSGSAPLSPWMVTQWHERYGVDVLNFFGSNEGMALVSSTVDIPSHAERATYFPRFGVADFEWSSRMSGAIATKLVDPITKQIITERDQTGEMAIKGPTIFPGYYKHTDLSEKVFDDEGYFYSGDLFALDGVGDTLNRYRFVGRLKDLIIRGGMKISPEELEVLIQEHPSVKEVAVIGCADRRIDDEAVVAVVVLNPEKSLTKAELVDFLKEKDIAHYKLPKRLEIVDVLPRNPVGKILKRNLRDMLCGNSADLN